MSERSFVCSILGISKLRLGTENRKLSNGEPLALALNLDVTNQAYLFSHCLYALSCSIHNRDAPNNKWLRNEWRKNGIWCSGSTRSCTESNRQGCLGNLRSNKQSVIDQRIKEHVGQTTAFQQVGAAFNQHLMAQQPRFPGIQPSAMYQLEVMVLQEIEIFYM
ncbi:hypothetical protein L6164_006192 [Bauhinia variegata]|uniref:Uncharacterized protein n=1 Tax=Bauhinia variegata TaxID=167791 RepID=A0ACB9PVR8_BAUVA|nr:hypothetical protein L6164_006192 [Bauhinia variegata]